MWGTVWYPLRLLEGGGLHGLWSILVAYTTAMLPGLVLLWRHGDELRRDPKALVVMALANGWCNVAFVLAVIEGPVMRVLLLFYLSPLWSVILARLILDERLSREARLVFAMALAGALIMLWNPALGLPWPQGAGDWLAVSAGFGFALSNVMIRRMQAVSIWTRTSVSWVGVLVIALFMLGLSGQAVPAAVSGGVWLGAVGLGVFGIIIMTVTVQYGVSHLPIHRSAVILLFELVAGAVSSYLLAHELVKAQEWVGGALIVAAAYVSAHAARKQGEVD
ncbi:DMT family transporter [Thiohalobacter thiocyanaticus]|uniref:DMT family transporter n=2 Tax=Thiohalobacter thiocyanaticus TaxID=585455 RepID=A0A426QEF3_9GAMM|nr:DMT family transporter [Thiohalobacter thiocyanaticus]